MEPTRKRSATRPLLSVAVLVSLGACGTSRINSDNPSPSASAPAASALPAAVTPRLMPSGNPACGNVASRAPRPAECDTK